MTSSRMKLTTARPQADSAEGLRLTLPSILTNQYIIVRLNSNKLSPSSVAIDKTQRHRKTTLMTSVASTNPEVASPTWGYMRCKVGPTAI